MAMDSRHVERVLFTVISPGLSGLGFRVLALFGKKESAQA
jgi:hypothetical protein